MLPGWWMFHGGHSSCRLHSIDALQKWWSALNKAWLNPKGAAKAKRSWAPELWKGVQWGAERWNRHLFPADIHRKRYPYEEQRLNAWDQPEAVILKPLQREIKVWMLQKLSLNIWDYLHKLWACRCGEKKQSIMLWARCHRAGQNTAEILRSTERPHIRFH